MIAMFVSQISALALNVWREAMRDKVVHVLAGSGIALMLFSLILGKMAVGGDERVLQNFGFWIMGIWGLAAVMYLGSNIVKGELLRKTVYLILSRPVTRPVFLLGKYFGMLLVLASAFILLASAWLILLESRNIKVVSDHFIALAFIFGEWILLASISIFFASFTSPLLHNFFLTGICFLGHWLNDLKIFSENMKDIVLKNLLIAIYYILPNLEALNFRDSVLYHQPITPSLLLSGVQVLLCWIAVFLISANLIFTRRKLI